VVRKRQANQGHRSAVESTDELARQYELRIDGIWQPARLVRRLPDGKAAGDTDEGDKRREALLNVNEFNIRQVEAACGHNDLELRDDHGGLWMFRPSRIKFEGDAFAEGELRRADDQAFPLTAPSRRT
jgi:hypothetical protein